MAVQISSVELYPFAESSLFSEDITRATVKIMKPYTLWTASDFELASIIDLLINLPEICSESYSSESISSDSIDSPSSNSISSDSSINSPISIDSSSSEPSSPELASQSTSDEEAEALCLRRLNLSGSQFSNGCVCGHHVEIRDVVYDPRKRRNTRCPGITIRPKNPPLNIGLRV